MFFKWCADNRFFTILDFKRVLDTLAKPNEKVELVDGKITIKGDFYVSRSKTSFSIIHIEKGRKPYTEHRARRIS